MNCNCGNASNLDITLK